MGVLGSLDIVFHNGFQAYQQPTEALGILHTLDKLIHSFLTTCESHLTIVFPVIFVTHLTVRVTFFKSLAPEDLLVDGNKGVIVTARGPGDKEIACPLPYQRQFYKHIVDIKNPISRRQLEIFLLNSHIIDEIDIRTFWDAQMHLLNMKH